MHTGSGLSPNAAFPAFFWLPLRTWLNFITPRVVRVAGIWAAPSERRFESAGSPAGVADGMDRVNIAFAVRDDGARGIVTGHLFARAVRWSEDGVRRGTDRLVRVVRAKEVI